MVVRYCSVPNQSETLTLIMRWGPVDRVRFAGRLFTVGHPFAEPRDLPLQPLDQLPLRRDGGVQVLARLVLMGDTAFKLIEAGGVVWRAVGHGGGI